MKKIKLLGILSLLVLGIALIIKIIPTEAHYKTVKISNITLKAEVADTEFKRMKGLMGHEQLSRNHAMLFTFDNPGYYGIWMMNVSFPIDILWIDDKMKIVDITEVAQPCLLYCPTYMPEEKALYVLEASSGFVEKNNIRVGDKISVSKY